MTGLIHRCVGLLVWDGGLALWQSVTATLGFMFATYDLAAGLLLSAYQLPTRLRRSYVGCSETSVEFWLGNTARSS